MLCLINSTIALVILSIKGYTTVYFEKMSHATDYCFLTVGFANLLEKALHVLGHFPTGMLLSFQVF